MLATNRFIRLTAAAYYQPFKALPKLEEEMPTFTKDTTFFMEYLPVPKVIANFGVRYTKIL